MAHVRYTLAMNVYLADFYSWIAVCLANFAGAQTLANPNGAQLAYHTEHECQEHSLYCHLNASHLILHLQMRKIWFFFVGLILSKSA